MEPKSLVHSKVVPGPAGGIFGWRNIREFIKGPDFLSKLSSSYGGLCTFQMGPIHFYLVTEPDYVREILITHGSKLEKAEKDKVVMGRLLGSGLVTSDGDYHKRQRKLSQPAFRKKRIAMYAEAMTHQTEKMLQTWKDGQTFDMVHKMNELTMHIVTETLFHVDVSEQAKRIGQAIEVLQDVANRDFKIPFPIPRWLPIPQNIKANQSAKYLDNLIYKMIQSRRQEEKDGVWKDRGDLMSALIQASDEEDGSRMTDKQLKDELLTLFVAGHETTSNALSWTWYLLSQNPQQEQTLHEELDRVLQGKPVEFQDLIRLPYLQQVLKESMRLYPPAWTLNARCPMEDIDVDGYKIPKGAYIFVSPYALHRESRNFSQPETFSPERFAPEQEKEIHRYAYIPFGAGHRVCIGNSFAMMEAALILARIAQQYRVLTLSKQPPAKLAQITMSPKGGLQVQLQARSPQAS